MARPAGASTRVNHLLKHWPADPIRPSSVSVQTYLQSRLPKAQQPPSQSLPQKAGPISESSVSALTSLLNNRYAKQYPLPKRLRHPASNPDHYDDLIREFEEAPNRDFFGRIAKRLKGILRLQ